MSHVLFEYQDDGRDPIDPDSVWVSVTDDLLTDAVDYCLSKLSAQEALELLSEYVYDSCANNSNHWYATELVRDYLKTH